MKLLVGLGNPGYDNTRHNTGFMVIDELLKEKKINTPKSKFKGEYYEYIDNGEKIIVLKPMSFINLSGQVIKKYVDYFKINIEDVLIVYDDMSMELGKIRLREKGSPGGHNGINDINSNLGTDIYKRLKIGIGNSEIDAADYVLGKFSSTERKIIDEAVIKAVEICMKFNEKNFDELKNEYNG